MLLCAGTEHGSEAYSRQNLFPIFSTPVSFFNPNLLNQTAVNNFLNNRRPIFPLNGDNRLRRFANCTASNGLTGICVPGLACNRAGGVASGICSLGLTCCVGKSSFLIREYVHITSVHEKNTRWNSLIIYYCLLCAVQCNTLYLNLLYLSFRQQMRQPGYAKQYLLEITCGSELRFNMQFDHQVGQWSGRTIWETHLPNPVCPIREYRWWHVHSLHEAHLK